MLVQMTILYLKTVIRLLMILSADVMMVNSQTLTLYRDSFVDGDTLELNVDNCTHSLPPEFVGKIACGNFSVNCARFYSTENCMGNSLEIRKNQVFTHWNLESIKSIGPCETEMEATTACTETKHPIPIVELFEHADFEGRVSRILLDHWTCFEIPRALKHKVSSIRMNADICVELHSKSNCSDEGLSVRRNLPLTAVNLAQWGFDDKTSSISLCGLSCRRKFYNTSSQYSTIAESDMDTVPRCPHVTIFDETNFTGNSKHLVVREDCVNLVGDWEAAAKSIHLHQRCVILYHLFNCGKKESFYLKNSVGFNMQRLELMLMSSNTEQGDRYNLDWFGSKGQLRSIGPCVGKKPSQPLISIYVLIGLFVIGISVAWVVNGIVRRRDLRERQIHVYQDKPS